MNKTHKNIFFSLTAAAGIIAIALSFFQLKAPEQTSPDQKNLLAVKPTITRVGERAFGSLASLQGASAPTAESANFNFNKTVAADSTKSVGATVSRSAIAQATPANADAPVAVSGAGGSSASSIAMPARYPIAAEPEIKYVYKGEPFTQESAKLDVLKRQPTSISAGQAVSSLMSAGFGLINLESFNDLQLANVMFSEDREFGYNIYVDLQNGNLSLSQNYYKWPQYREPQAPITEKPADADIIAIADKFLLDHSIAKDNFGQPTITNNYYYAMEADAARSSIMPIYYESIQVLYPQKTDGKEVYAQYGGKLGLTVDVNLRQKMVSNVYGLNLMNFQASAYDAITDTEKILAQALKPPYVIMPYLKGAEDGATPPAKQVEVSLGTPTLSYMEVYKYEEGGMGGQYLVPAYAFPIISEQTAYNYGRNAILVPLIADFWTDNNLVKPMMEGGVK